MISSRALYMVVIGRKPNIGIDNLAKKNVWNPSWVIGTGALARSSEQRLEIEPYMQAPGSTLSKV